MGLELDRYVKQKQVALGRSLAPRKKIYLDLNFWIRLREAADGTKGDPVCLELLSVLREGVADGRLVCPISEAVFLELMKQKREEGRRRATALLIDELSLGVTLMRSDARIGTEVHSFLLTALGKGADLHPMQDLVWTSVAYICGETHPTFPWLDATTELSLQKSFADHMWTASLADMLARGGDRDEPEEPFSALSQETNAERDKYAHEIVSFSGAYKIELAGGLDAAGAILADVMCAHAEKHGHAPPLPGSAAWLETRDRMQKLVFHSLARKKDKLHLLRTLHISTALHAALRMDKPRRFKPNDFLDFQHATSALAYCDYFFTEGPLRELVSQRNLGFSVFGCRVVSNPVEALAAAKRLLIAERA